MKSSQSHLPSLLGSLLFIVGAMLFLSVAVLMGITALASLMTGKSIEAQQTILFVVSIIEALILFIAAYVSIQKYRRQPFADQESSFTIAPWQIVVSLLIAGVSILIGYQIGANESLNWLVLPSLTIPAVVLPLFVVLGLAIRGIPLGTRWQSWNVFGIAMTLAPFILIFIEALAVIVILILVVAFLMSQPNFGPEFQRFSREIYTLGPQSDMALSLLLPYITKPGVIAVALFYFAILVPMVEEFIKPLGVWFFANKLTSPAQGFALGALSGAAYALIETLGVSAQTVDWASLLLSRIGTGMLHITTSALMGAGIYYAVREHRYLRLLGIYILSVSLHGLWNGLAILYGFSTLVDYLDQVTPLGNLGTPIIVGMIFLTVVFFIILVLSHRRMKATLPQPKLEEPIP